MKRAFALILAILMTVTWWGSSAAEEKQTEYQSGDYNYVLLEDGTAEITDYRGEASSLSIPEMLDGYTITSIGGNSFFLCWNLSSVTIPDSVTSIGEGAFYECSSLSSVTIPDSVTSIGEGAFWGCNSLSSVTIPDSVTSVGNRSFYGCKSLSSVTIPDSVMSIGNSSFYGCKSLTSVTIPDSVTSIGNSAFSLCESLTSVMIPDSVTNIGLGAFSGCESLSNVAFPDSITSIGDSTFLNCMSLSSVTIPDSVTNIGYGAFSWCNSLSIVTIPDSVTSIGSSAFFGCESLSSMTIPDSVTSIGNGAFFGCESLTSVAIPDSVTSIGDGAFYRCDKLTLTVGRDSYAKGYAIENDITYIYLDNESLNHVSDLANVLNTEEEAELEAQAGEVFQLTGFDIILHTTNDSQNKGPMDYSFDYYHAFRDSATYPDGALFAVMFDTRDYYEAARGSGIELLTNREAYELGRVVQGKLSDGDYFGAMSDYVAYVKNLIVPFASIAVEDGIRPIGDTSRLNPLLVGQKVQTEINEDDEYKYSHTIEFKGFVREKGTLTIKIHVSISKCSDGIDRDISIWDSDFELFDSEYSQIYVMADGIGTEKTGLQTMRVLMFPETSTDMIVIFNEIPEGKLFVRFEPMNSYKFDEKNKAKGTVWFEIDP